ncbi:MAG TPA: tyrosine-type recombinase/integrase [Stenomitos sp.]
MGKRGQNEGSVHKRKDGRWVGVMSLGFEGSKRKRKYFYGDTAKEVSDQLAKARVDLLRGLPPTPDNVTVGKFLEDWLSISEARVRPSTFVSYRRYVRNHIIPEIGKVTLTKLTPLHVEEMLKAKRREELAPRTIQYILTVLRMALKRAEKMGLVARNVAALVDPVKVQHKEVQPLTVAEAVQFLDLLKGHRHEALYALTMALGLRQGEVLGLHWKDVDLKKKVLRVRVSLQRIDGKFQFVEPKTARSKRTLPIPDSVIAKLHSHRIRQLEERLMAADLWQETDLVFTSKVGAPLHGSNVTHEFQKLLDKAKLPRQRFHDLRHTCASILLAGNTHPRVVMEMLGHSQIAVTMNTYSHVMPTILHETADKMDRLLGGG